MDMEHLRLKWPIDGMQSCDSKARRRDERHRPERFTQTDYSLGSVARTSAL